MTREEAIIAAKTFRKDADELLQRMKEHKVFLALSPAMRKKLIEKIKASTKGGDPGEGSARKAQLLANEYKKAAWSNLSPSEKAATNKAKAKGNAAGKQFVPQPKKVAAKTKPYR
jgi:hypothetical protein